MIRLLPVLVLAALSAAWLRHMQRRHGLGVLLWRWHSGHTLDGMHRTNATWTKPSRGNRAVLHPTGHAVWWHHQPRLYRAGIRTGAELVAVALVYDLRVHTAVTLAILAALAVAGLVLAVRRVMYAIPRWRDERHHVKPLAWDLMRQIPEPPSRLEIERKRGSDVITGAVIEWPPETELGAPEQRHALEAASVRLGLDAPDATWNRTGRNRSVVFTQSEPPPVPVCWEGRIEAAVARAAFNELVFGIG